MRKRRARALGVAVLVGLAGCQSVESPNRPAPYEFRASPTDPIFHFPSSQLPVRFWAEPTGALPEYVELGMEMWAAQFLYGEFWGVLVADSLQADIIVRMPGTPPPDAPLTDDPAVQTCDGVTHIPEFGDDGTGQLRFDARIDIEMGWFSGQPSDIANCLARVTAHEIGHAMGIFNHSFVPNDLMAIPVTARQPTARDASTIQTLYHIETDILPFQP